MDIQNARDGRRMTRLLLALSICLLAGCQAALFGAVSTAGGRAGSERSAGIVFDREHQLALDVYRPSDAHNASVVVFFYGGTWQSGQRSWYRFVGQSLAKRGVVVVIPDYRKFPEVRSPDFVRDAAAAVKWAHDNANTYGGDPKSLFVMGHSAGAHIGALLATDARYLEAVGMRPRDLAGFIGLAGPYDFAPITDKDLIPIFGAEPAQQRDAQPVNHVDGDEPPMLLLHGQEDKTVWTSNTKALDARMRAANEPVETKFYPGIGHAKILLSLAPMFARWAPAIDDSLRFIQAHSSRTTPAH